LQRFIAADNLRCLKDSIIFLRLLMKHSHPLVVIGTLVASSCLSMADVMFFDDFNSENGGIGELDYGSFVNWDTTRGTVDLIGNGFYDFWPGNGLYVDTEGNGYGGTIVTKQLFNFVPGTTYTLSFDLAGNGYYYGNYRSELVTVGSGGSIVDQTITLTSEAPFELFSYSFTVGTPTTAEISFAAGENGVTGLKLDNIQLSSDAPAPAPDSGSTLLLSLCGFLTVGIASVGRNGRCSTFSEKIS
jgi:hypothetical protein